MMLNRLTRPLAFLMLVTTAHGELSYRTSESCDENLKNLVVVVLVGVLLDWLRIKLKIPIPSTEKLGYAGEKMLGIFFHFALFYQETEQRKILSCCQIQ